MTILLNYLRLIVMVVYLR